MLQENAIKCDRQIHIKNSYPHTAQFLHMLPTIPLLLLYSFYFYTMQQLDLFAAFETAKPGSETEKPLPDAVLEHTAMSVETEMPATNMPVGIDTDDILHDDRATALLANDQILSQDLMYQAIIEDSANADWSGTLVDPNLATKENIVSFEFVQPATVIQPAKKFKTAVVLPGPKVAGKRGRRSYSEMEADIVMVEVPDDAILFAKQYYSMGEVAQWFHVNQSLLRYWENEFDILKPRKTRKGDRLFRPEDIKNLQLIYFLLRQRKFSLEGAKQYLKENKAKADVNMQLIGSLTKFRAFLLEWKANLGA